VHIFHNRSLDGVWLLHIVHILVWRKYAVYWLPLFIGLVIVVLDSCIRAYVYVLVPFHLLYFCDVKIAVQFQYVYFLFMSNYILCNLVVVIVPSQYSLCAGALSVSHKLHQPYDIC